MTPEDDDLQTLFALQAMNALIQKSQPADVVGFNGSAINDEAADAFRREIAKRAYDYADAMIAERTRRYATQTR